MNRAVPSQLTRYSQLLLWSVLIHSCLASASAEDATPASQPVKDAPVFETQIRPLLMQKCGKCHGAKTRKAGLDLSTLPGLLKGGESGEPAVGDSLEESLLWDMIEAGEMPPADEPRLSAADKDLIRRWLTGGAPAKTATVQVTQHDILPHLYARCVVCHGRRRQEGDLDLRSVASMLQGGKSGPAVIPGNPQESLLLKRVHAKDMPPPKELIRAGVRPLESAEIAAISTWIAQGAKRYEVSANVQTDEPDTLVSDEDRQFWSFQPPQKTDVPTEFAKDTPLDAFLLDKLRERGLSFAAEASRPALIRRVAFDLTGLPPKWADVQRFMLNESPDWYEQMVDFYLDSPHYGEHWGRLWLDLAGYADSEGKRSADPLRSHAWRYRDYVIAALNRDKPYDQFLIEQIAGDELFDFENASSITPEMMNALIATGFLRMAPDGTGSDIVDTVEERFEVVADELEVLGSSVMGLTLRCAQCHSHKYDPIPQRDYYRLVAVFQGAYDVYDWLKPTSVSGQSQGKHLRRMLPAVTPEIRSAWLAEKGVLEQELTELRDALAAKKTALETAHLEKQLAQLPQELHADLQKMLQTPAKERGEIARFLAEKFEKRLTVSEKQLRKAHPDFDQLKKDTDQRIKTLQAEIPAEPMVRALWDRGEPSPTWVFRRGQFNTPGELVGPGVPSVLSDGRTPFQPVILRPGSTGRRLAFARWLTDRGHPLTARVAVNRVWHEHFGRGIVESLGNFGSLGSPPSHPELLDWLAVSFMENGWSLKWLHRQLMNSRAYRQSSEVTDQLLELDPQNVLLSRMPLRRLKAESLRDSLLSVSGQLDDRRFGKPDPVTVRPDGLVTAGRGEAGWRRTVYVQQRRKEVLTILETFDLPQMRPNCLSRPNSTVAPQALHLLNNGLVREWSRHFAQRITKEVPANTQQQVERLYEIALSRRPTSAEITEALAALEQLTRQWQQAAVVDNTDDGQVLPPETRALANLCHVVMNSAAFLYVD